MKKKIKIKNLKIIFFKINIKIFYLINNYFFKYKNINNLIKYNL